MALTPDSITVSRFLPCLAALACGLLASCYPYPEDQPLRPAPGSRPMPARATPGAPSAVRPPPASPSVAATPAPPAVVNQANQANQAPPALPQRQASRPPAGDQATEVPTPNLPVASKAPGKEGYVLSPYNNKLILVRGIPSGTVVPDPAFPASSRKSFRVP